MCCIVSNVIITSFYGFTLLMTWFSFLEEIKCYLANTNCFQQLISKNQNKEIKMIFLVSISVSLTFLSNLKFCFNLDKK